MKENSCIPKFVSVVAVTLGCVDLFRGFMHTILLEYAARHIAGLDLSTSLAADLLRLLGTFGISNYVTGIMLVLVGWKARPLALMMLGVIPAAYAVGIIGIRINTTSYTSSQAVWGGTRPLMIYMAISLITCVVGVWMTRQRRKGTQ